MRTTIGLLTMLSVSTLMTACGGARARPEPSGAAKPEPCGRVRPAPPDPRVGLERKGSAVALTREEGTSLAYVADADGPALRTFDVTSGRELAVTPLAGTPSLLLVLHDGRLVVALRDRNSLLVLEPARAGAPLEARCEIPVAAEPVGLAQTPDDRTLLVTSAWGRKLAALDAGTLAARFEVDLPREPRDVLVDDDGKRAFVAHVVGARLSVVDLETPEHDVRTIPLAVRRPPPPGELRAPGLPLKDSLLAQDAAHEEPLPEQGPLALRAGCQGFALAKTIDPSLPALAKVERGGAPGGRVFAPMVTVHPGETDAPSAGYGAADGLPTEMAMVSVVDAAAERPLTRHLLAGATRHREACLLPRAAAYDPGAGSLLVACAGIDAVLELDARAADPVRVERRRWKLAAGPLGLAVDARARRAVVWSQFVRELSVLDLDRPEAPPRRVALGNGATSTLSPALARGRELFHRTGDPRISGDGRACASCHPDGRDDALTWATPEGPRQTILLAGRLGASPPFGWTGKSPSVEQHVRETFTRLQGTGLEREDQEALLAYLAALPAPRLDAPRDPARRELVERGKAIFHDPEAACATCHGGAALADGRTHDLRTRTVADATGAFDTPTLRYVGGSGPYFHDGRYPTLEALLASPDARMGHTLHLSRDEVRALVAYLETL